MKLIRFATVVTVTNFALLIVLLAQGRLVEAQNVAPVLRGRALEIVDDHGKVRASIKVLSAGPARKADGSPSEANGKTYPETVLLRLIDPNGRPSVKIGGSVQGSALGLVGETDEAYVVLKAEGPESSLKMISKNGKQQIIKP